MDDEFERLWTGGKPRFVDPAYVEYQRAITLVNMISIKRKRAAKRGDAASFRAFEAWRAEAIEEYLRWRGERERARAAAAWRPREPVDKDSVLAVLWPGGKPRMGGEEYAEYQRASSVAGRLGTAADKALRRARRSDDPSGVWEEFLAERDAIIDEYHHARLQRQAEAARERIADRETVARADAAAFVRTARLSYGIEIDLATGRVTDGEHGGRLAGSYARLETPADGGDATLHIEGEGFEIIRPIPRRRHPRARDFTTTYNTHTTTG